MCTRIHPHFDDIQSDGAYLIIDWQLRARIETKAMVVDTTNQWNIDAQIVKGHECGHAESLLGGCTNGGLGGSVNVVIVDCEFENNASHLVLDPASDAPQVGFRLDGFAECDDMETGEPANAEKKSRVRSREGNTNHQQE